MQTRIRRFLRQESGGVTVEWVVLAAATVGIGLGATAILRGGADSLSDTMSARLNDTEVAVVCEDAPAYALQILTGDNEAVAIRVNEQFATMSDDEIRQIYAEIVEKTNILHEAGEPEAYVNEILDYAYLAAQELERRRLALSGDVQSFDDLKAAITGVVSGGACGSGSGGSGSGGGVDDGRERYELMAFADEEARNLTDEFRRYDPEAFTQLIDDIYEKYTSASQSGDRMEMQRAVDYMYLAYQAALANGSDSRAIALAEEAFRKLRDDYISNHSSGTRDYPVDRVQPSPTVDRYNERETVDRYDAPPTVDRSAPDYG
ncbi:hypothetical protein [Pararhodobacter sp.]|uniref:Flp family type IVb pilin n=1 Tax=Pararhodobacter sp. TaxID=2127056 RepID=UPI002AFFE6E0|nr:hypothetical protein [Pararhodobacter sp.]